MVVANPFYLDLSEDIGLFILTCLIALSTFLFYRRSYSASGLLSFFVGFLLLYNEINFLIALIPMFIGLLLVVGGVRR